MYDNTNSGALFINDKQGNEKRPDMKGTLNVEGVEFRVSARKKESQNGKKFVSLSLQPKEDKGLSNKQADSTDDSFPF